MDFKNNYKAGVYRC